MENRIEKSWWLSKTIWLAIGQAVLGIIVALQAQPEFASLGWIMTTKSVLDVILRVGTIKEIV